MNLKDLTPSQRKTLMKQLQEEANKEANAIKETRKMYKEKVDKVVPKLFEKLFKLSGEISKAKTYVYENLESLIGDKSYAYQKEDDQQTHSFSSIDGKQTITIGFRVNDGWDDTVNMGVDKVKAFISTMAKDKNSKALVDTILRLLSKDAKGNLKASRVLQLQKLADDIDNKEFSDAINIIKDAYRPQRTKQFVAVRYKNERNEPVELPLSITDVPLVIKENV